MTHSGRETFHHILHYKRVVVKRGYDPLRSLQSNASLFPAVPVAVAASAKSPTLNFYFSGPKKNYHIGFME